jgi:hypothetical protein
VAVGAAGRTAGRGRCVLDCSGRGAGQTGGRESRTSSARSPAAGSPRTIVQSTSSSRIWLNSAGTLGRSQHRAEHADAIQEQVVTSWGKIVDRPKEGLVDSQSAKHVACTRPD